MDTATLQTIYSLVAFWGIMIYCLAGWKKSKSPFDLSIFLDSMISAGFIGIIAAGAGLYTMGLSFIGLATAFFLPWGIDKTRSTVTTLTAAQPVAQPKNVCPLTGTTTPPANEKS